MKITPNLLASLIGGIVEGDGEIEITGFAKIEEAGRGDISFITNPKYAHYAGSTKASALLVSKDFKPEGEVASTLIRVEDPYTALALLMTQFMAKTEGPKGIEQPSFVAEGVEIPEDCYIGAFAYIGKGVKLGKNVKIYPHSFIGEGVEIGNDTIIRSNVNIYEGCKIGQRCILHSGCVIGSDGFGFAPSNGVYQKIPQMGIVKIEDDVEIGANTTIDRATLGETVIGHGTKLDNLIQVAHNVVIGHDNVMAAQVGIAGSTKIGNSNRIGGQVGFAGHINFGSNCEVGAQSGIPKGYGDNCRIMGYPAMDVGTFARAQAIFKRLPEINRTLQKLIENNEEKHTVK